MTNIWEEELPSPSDRIFMGLSQSLMVHEGTHNPNVTLKGYPKKFWGLFDQKAHKTQQITLSQPQKGGLSLSLKSHRQTYNPKCKPKCLPNKTRGLVRMVMHTACATCQIP